MDITHSRRSSLLSCQLESISPNVHVFHYVLYNIVFTKVFVVWRFVKSRFHCTTVISCNYEPVHGRVHFSTLGCKAFIILPLVYSACTLYIGLVFDY